MQCGWAAHGWTCVHFPAAVAEASEQWAAAACAKLSAGQGRQAPAWKKRNKTGSSPDPTCRALQVQVVLAVAKGVGRHLQFLEAVLHIRHMRYYIIYALVRGRLVLGDLRTNHCPVAGAGDRGLSVQQPVQC